MLAAWLVLFVAGVALGGAAWLGLRRHARFLAALEQALGPAEDMPGDRETALVERVARFAELQSRIAHSHPITELPTREPLLRRMREEANGTLAVLNCIDVERLCAFDPAQGDALLKAIAARLTAMVAKTRLIAHVDRTHLAIWFAADRADAAAELQALSYALGNRLTVGERTIEPDVAIRSCIVEAGVPTPEMALTRTIASFTAVPAAAGATPIDVQAIARERFQLEQDLRRAVDGGELRVHYQPLIDAQAGRVCGAEALLRWQHPQRGLVPPVQFVPIVEDAGLAPEIGLWTLNAALRQARTWHAAGLGAMRVAVNVSGRQLEAPDLDRLVARTLARHALGGDALEIELTESVAMGDGRHAAALLGALRAQGVSLAIDDFGTGYSSLSTLRSLSFDKIKIDREFVTDVDSRRDSQAICASVIALGRGLGIRVLAEGVETAAEYQWLRRHGCRHFQGFYFARPLAEEAFVAYVRDRAALAGLLAVERADVALRA